MKLDNLINEELALLSEVAGNAVSDEFFDDVIRGVGGTPSEEKRKFFRAWKRAENTKAKNNPLATTWDKQVTGQTNFNSVGVKNYPDQDTGVQATINTLTKGSSSSNYKNLVKKLQTDTTAEELANTPDAFSAWTGSTSKSDYVARALGTKISAKNVDKDFTDQEKQILGSIPGASSGISPTPWSDGKRQHYYRFGTDFETNLSLVYPNHKGHIVVLEKGRYQKPTRATWKFQGNDVIVTTDDGIITMTYNPTQSKPDVQIEKDWDEKIDTIQDWISYATLAGSWFFPIYTDVVDIMNAAVYAMREKYLDASLSMLAAVPIVGNLAARSLKTAIKYLRGRKGGEAAIRAFTRAFKMKDAAGMAKFLTKLTETGKIPAGLYDDVAKGLEKAYSQVDKLKNLDQVKEMKKLQSAIDEIHDSIGLMYKATATASKAGKAAGVFSKITKLTGITPKVGKQITQELLERGARIYTAQLKKNPKEFVKLYNIIQKSQKRGVRAAGSWENLYKTNPAEYAKQVGVYMKNNPIANSKLFADKLAKLALKPNYFKEFLKSAPTGNYLLRTNPLAKFAWNAYTKLPASIARLIDNNYDLDDATKEKLRNPIGVAFDPDMIAAIYAALLAAIYGSEITSISADKDEE